MADENPSDEQSPATPPGSIPPKRETVRLPSAARPDEEPIKGETVRIKQSGRLGALGEAAPKKESSRLIGALPGETNAPPAGAPPTLPKPFVPTPIGAQKPTAQLASKPLAGAPPLPPKPPVIAKPTMPLKPTPAAEPVTMKGATPKKETARIQVPPEPRPPMPKATVKMQPTQVISQAPPPAIRTAELPLVASAAAATGSSPMGLAVGVFITSLFALVMSLWVYLS